MRRDLRALLLLACGLTAAGLGIHGWADADREDRQRRVRNRGAAFGNAPSDWAEGTEALDDGATRDFYNRAALLPWDNFLGDWRDANDEAQGPVPYASLNVIDQNTPRYLEWGISQLVQEWLDGTYRNQGLMVRIASGSASYNFRSKEHAVASERPELEIVTASGTQVLAPHGDTWVSASTFGGFGDSDEMRISTTRNALLRFDLTGFPPDTPILSAILRIWVFGEFGSAEVGIFRSAQGHDEPPSPPILGIAAAFDLDAGLGSHPDVLLFSDFESATWGDDWTFGTGASTLTRVTSDPPILFESFDRTALRARIPDGANTGMNVGFKFEEETGSEPDEMYFRYYLRVGDDWNTVDGGKLPGMSGTYGVAGWGGRPSDGTNGWSARGTLSRSCRRPATRWREPAADRQLRLPRRHGRQLRRCAPLAKRLSRTTWRRTAGTASSSMPQDEHTDVKTTVSLRAWVDGRLAWEKTRLAFPRRSFPPDRAGLDERLPRRHRPGGPRRHPLHRQRRHRQPVHWSGGWRGLLR